MNRRSIALAMIAAAAVTGSARAQTPAPEVETLDLTIVLMPEGTTAPAAVTRVIELPAAVAEAARENAARGLDQADAARQGRGNGLETADAAREQGRERAQQGREDLRRGPPETPPGLSNPGAGPPGGLPGGGPPDSSDGPPGNLPGAGGPPPAPGPSGS